MLKNYPQQIKFIVWNEACERYSYYGMRSILVIFLTQYFLLTNDKATADYHYFVSLCYLTPLLGGYLADRFLGKYKTIIYLSLIYCLGHAFLAIFEQSQSGFYAGLFLIALGSGGIKPCVSAHVGDQFKPGQNEYLRRVFDLFYWMINFGSMFSSLITPWTLEAYGPAIAFGIPGILMFIATIIFWMGRNHYVHVPPSGSNPNAPSKMLLAGLKGLVAGHGFTKTIKEKYNQQAIDDAKAALTVMKIFSAITVFWALFDQHGSSWVLQAQKMVLETSLFGFEFKLLPAQIPALNPIMVMALIPITTLYIYPLIEKVTGIKMNSPRRMILGMFMATTSFVPIALYEYMLDGGASVHALWQFIPYLIITLAEVMVSITGLEFAYTQAPKSMKSTIMSFWMLTVFLGNFITALISDINIFQGGHYFSFFVVLMGIFSLFFYWIIKDYQVKDYMHE